MCSAPKDSGAGRAAIVLAAVELIGRHGVEATTVRAVAQAAGVSAPLIIHHFASKDGLVAACDEHVQARLAAAATAIATEMGELNLQALLAQGDIGPALAYVARSLHSSGPVGQWWFSTMADMADDLVQRLTTAGIARRLDDPDMVALLLLAMDLGLLLVRPLVEARLGADLTDPAVLERWATAEYDLLTNGLLVSPTTDPEPAAATEDEP